MQNKIILALIATTLMVGCTIPCIVVYRNISNDTVRLYGKLNDRWLFKKLPNTVGFLDTAQTTNQIYGEWKSNGLLTWTDSISFHIDIPPYTILDLSDVSNRLILGARSPDVLLIVVASNRMDTLTPGDSKFILNKFQSRHPFLSTPIYYYDTK